MIVKVPRDLWARIRRQLETGYPYEQCGILVGRTLGADVEVEAIREARNLVVDRKADRYEIDPHDQLIAERDLAVDGRAVVGYYHSHPDHPARPSETDAKFAWPRTIYVIVSIEKGVAKAATAWVLRESEQRFDEVSLDVEKTE
ncbi:MAG: M67 family metallopeptidase [Planctomycetes bacterium]|nr:M67 family metallopeptidase [Planctomycetota bacterium]MBI3848483.1 M67 family metallopeptidase [Planctomycetota bacterium]